MDLTERVRRGMSFLDKEYPDHVNTFDPEDLCMNDCRLCVVAQASGGEYRHEMDRLDLGHAQAVELGFTLDKEGWVDYPHAWRLLRDEWLRQYGERIDAIALAANESEADRHDRY